MESNLEKLIIEKEELEKSTIENKKRSLEENNIAKHSLKKLQEEISTYEGYLFNTRKGYKELLAHYNKLKERNVKNI